MPIFWPTSMGLTFVNHTPNVLQSAIRVEGSAVGKVKRDGKWNHWSREGYNDYHYLIFDGNTRSWATKNLSGHGFWQRDNAHDSHIGSGYDSYLDNYILCCLYSNALYQTLFHVWHPQVLQQCLYQIGLFLRRYVYSASCADSDISVYTRIVLLLSIVVDFFVELCWYFLRFLEKKYDKVKKICNFVQYLT